MRIALVSLDQAWQDKNLNKDRSEIFVRKAANKNCKLIIFPEMTLTAFSMDNKFINDSAEDINKSETMNYFANLSKEYNINIIFGATLRDTSADLPQNSMCISSPAKGSSKIYSKVHPFSYAKEHKFIKPGNAFGRFKLDNLNFGASICYDLRFPTFYNLQNRDCDCFICIANWPMERIYHWKSLLVARAIENQVYMIGVNRVGKDGNNLEYIKSSYIISPAGDILESISIDNEMDIYEIEKDKIKKYRKQYPFIKDSKNNLYFELCEIGNSS